MRCSRAKPEPISDAHQKALDSINQELLPAASNEKLVEGLNELK